MKINGAWVFVASFAFMLYALSPVIYVGDSSLFAAASFSLGSAHPPGYPLLIQLGKLFTFLPLGNVALKVNLMSAVFGALACLMVFMVSMEVTGNRHASWAAALICGITPLFFLESIKAEAYTLNAFLSMAVFLFGLRILTGGDFFRNSLAAFFLVGMGMGNHHTIAFSGLALLLPLALRWREASLKWAVWGLLFFSAGFSVNLLLYLRTLAISGSGGLILYSYAGDFDSFVRILLRRDFGGTETAVKALASHQFPGWYFGLRNALYHILYSNTKPVLPFLVIGIVALRRDPKILLYFCVSAALWLLLLGRMVFTARVPDAGDVQTVSVYFLPVVPLLYCLVAAGFSASIEFMKKRQWKIMGHALPYAVAVVPFVLLPYSVRDYGLSGNFICYDYSRDMLSSLPPKSLLMNHTDNAMFATFYMRAVERIGEGTLVMNTGGQTDVFGLESSPPWKYASMYPDFFRREKSTLGELNRDFSLKGKLFVSNPLERTHVFSNSYDVYPYVFSAALWPKGPHADKFRADTREKFMRSFEKTGYERTLETKLPRDFLARELFTAYALNSAFYADFAQRRGDEATGKRFLRNALVMGYPEKFLWPYASFLITDGRQAEALALIAELKKYEALGNLGSILEQMVLSAIKEKGAGNVKGISG